MDNFVKEGDINQYPFFVKNWDFDATDKFYVLKAIPVSATPSPALTVTYTNGPPISVKYGQLYGIKAQGNEEPESYFWDHGIVKYNGKYYDPSYGSPVMGTQKEWEDYSLDGVGFTHLEWKYNPDKKPIILIWLTGNIKNNTSTTQFTTFKEE